MLNPSVRVSKHDLSVFTLDRHVGITSIWLDVADRETYELDVIMHRCRHGKAPQYLVDCCTPVTDVVGRQCLKSATQQIMVVPRRRLSTFGRRAFAVVWNSLPDDLRAQQDYESFRQRLKTWLFSSY